jgi:membrane protein
MRYTRIMRDAARGAGRLVRGVVAALRGRDLSLHAAAVTFYGAVALVPVGLLTIRLAALLGGADRVIGPAAQVVAAVPEALGADRAAASLVDAGLRLSPVGSLAALLPATLYGEGLRRSFVSLSGQGTGERAVGWRGRLLLLPALAVSPGLLLVLLLILPAAARLLPRGGLATLGGIVVSFLAVWIVLSPIVVWLFRVVGPGRPGWLASALAGSFTAANLSGFMHGFVLFCSLPLDLGLPFGGFDQVGAIVAVALWLYLFHLVLLVGYAITLQLDLRAVDG